MVGVCSSTWETLRDSGGVVSAAVPERVQGVEIERVVCAVDGSAGCDEAARQAAILAGSDIALTMVSVVTGELSREMAEAALEGADRTATETGAAPELQLLDGVDVSQTVVEQLRPGDLVAVGSHGRSRPAGMLLGQVASTLMHTSPVPLLVARKSPPGRAFPDEILVASDGSEASRLAAVLAAQIARRHSSRTTLLHVAGDDGPERHHELAVETTEIYEATGVEPVVLTEDGRAHARILEVARRERPSLVVVGSRGLGGAKALGSVSERVGHEAEQSVLLARGSHAERVGG